jgi:hypothetical protein
VKPVTIYSPATGRPAQVPDTAVRHWTGRGWNTEQPRRAEAPPKPAPAPTPSVSPDGDA